MDDKNLIQPEWVDEYKLITPIKIDGEESDTVTLTKPKRKHLVQAAKGKTEEESDNLMISYCSNLTPNEVMELDMLDYEGIQRQLAPFFTRSVWTKKSDSN